MHTITLYVAVNESGDSVTSADSASDAISTLDSDYGFEAVRVVVVNVNVPLPVVETIDVTVSDSTVPAQVSAA